jgi:hypothetical protein
VGAYQPEWVALVQLLRLAAVVLFILAAIGGLDIGIHWDLDTLLGVVAAGLACLAASDLVIPTPPPR